MATLIVTEPSKEQLEHIRKAEGELSKAGITFDVSGAVGKGKILTREWHLDWSLKGARLREKDG